MVKESVWNNNLVDKLKDLYLNKNMTAIDIGNELGFSKNAIIGKIHRLQLNILKENNFKTKVAKVKTSSRTKEETNFTIRTNIPKNNNITVENIQNLDGKIKIAHSVNNHNNLLNEEVSKQTSVYIDNFNEINQDIFQLNGENSNNIGKYKLADIEFNMCVWPFGEEDFLFCGAKTLAGKSYCQEHLNLVYFVTKKVPKKKYVSVEDEVEIEESEEFEEIEEIEEEI